MCSGGRSNADCPSMRPLVSVPESEHSYSVELRWPVQRLLRAFSRNTFCRPIRIDAWSKWIRLIEQKDERALNASLNNHLELIEVQWMLSIFSIYTTLLDDGSLFVSKLVRERTHKFRNDDDEFFLFQFLIRTLDKIIFYFLFPKSI